MSKTVQKTIRTFFASGLVVVMLFIAPLSVFGDTTVVVTGNTSAGENQPGWMFNRDITTSTPFDFNTNESSIGTGSINILPIGANAADKFIAENFINTEISNINSISYDFMIGAGGEEADKVHFYMNVYANFGSSSDNKFYDCRYNVVPTVGSVAGFTTVTFDPNQAYPVTTRGGADPSPYACPAIPAQMDNLSANSTIRVFAINVGDTSANDVGLDGYLDKVVVNLDSNGVTTYDFEPFVATAEITSPLNGSIKSGVVNFTAVYNDEDGNDGVQWAVRQGTCAAGVGTIYGNVDGKTTTFSWNGSSFSSGIDMTNDTPGIYCFVFNPTEDAGDPNLRVTSEFTLEAVVVPPPPVTNPQTKDECKNGGWEDFGFKNQGQCIRFVETEKDSR